MKTIYKTIIVLTVVSTILCLMPARSWAGKKQPGKQQLQQAEPGRRMRFFELTDYGAEQIMKRLEESDPDKAKQLEQLRAKDADAFKAELREVMRNRFGRKWRRHERGPKQGRISEGPIGQRGERMQQRFGRPDMQGGERGKEYMEWLEQNYPENAERLEELREKNPELFERRMQRGFNRHQRIIRAGKESPKLAEAIKESMELKDERDKLLEKINQAAGQDKKQQLIAQLEDVVGKRFDLIAKRKQIMYELLQKRLAGMQERLKNSQTDIEKWKNPAFKNENVKKRVQELIGKTESFKWD